MKTLTNLPPICRMLNNYALSSPARFHTAGHSGVAFSDSDNEFIRQLYAFCPYDITELSFSDNLLYAETVIAESEKFLGEIFHTYKTMYVTSGTTTSILICLKAMQLLDYTVLLTKNNHSSVLNALELFSVKHIFIDKETIEDILPCLNNFDGTSLSSIFDLSEKSAIDGTSQRATSDLSEKSALAQITGTAHTKYCLFVTTPNYYGMTIQDSKLWEFCRKNGIKIIADEAHGSHLPFFKKELSALNFADIVLHSVHKTLPALGASSLIHIVNPIFYETVKKCRKMLHTTSPSYIAMATTEYAAYYMAENGKKFYEAACGEVEAFKTELSESSTLRDSFFVSFSNDPTRLVLLTKGNLGRETAAELEKYGVFAEMADESRVVFIITPFNCHLLKKLLAALAGVFTKNERQANINLSPELPPLLKKVCVESILIYPPSAAIILRGEIFEKEHLELITNNFKNVIGLKENLEFYKCDIKNKTNK